MGHEWGGGCSSERAQKKNGVTPLMDLAAKRLSNYWPFHRTTAFPLIVAGAMMNRAEQNPVSRQKCDLLHRCLKSIAEEGRDQAGIVEDRAAHPRCVRRSRRSWPPARKPVFVALEAGPFHAIESRGLTQRTESNAVSRAKISLQGHTFNSRRHVLLASSCYNSVGTEFCLLWTESRLTSPHSKLGSQNRYFPAAWLRPPPKFPFRFDRPV